MLRYKISKIMESGPITIAESIKKTTIPEKRLRELLKEYQTYLKEKIVWKNRNTFYLPKEARALFPNFLLQLKKCPFYFEEKERIKLIYVLTFTCYQELSVFYYQNILNVSKNTILADIKKLRKYLITEKIEFVYERKKGFFLKGEEWQIRRLAFKWVNKLIENTSSKWQLIKWIHEYDFDYYTRFRENFELVKTHYSMNVIPGRLDAFYYFICLLQKRRQTYFIIWRTPQAYYLKKTATYAAINELFEGSKEGEILFFTIVLMTLTQGQLKEGAFDFLFDCASKMIRELERHAVTHFENYRKLLLDTFNHLVPAYHRIYYNLEIEQPFLNQVAKTYPEISVFTEAALVPLSKIVAKPIPPGEKAYFTLLFGAAIKNQQEKEKLKQMNALIVCPNGISTSMIMEAELTKLFPSIAFHTHYSLADVEKKSLKGYDLIFSSVPVTSSKPLFIIRPIMEQIEKNQLIKKVQEKFLVPGLSVTTPEEIWRTLLPYIELRKGVTEEKVLKILSRKMMRVMKRKEDKRPMLIELLTKDFIQITSEKMGWEEAMRKSAKPLLPEFIEERYMNAMIKKVKDYGAFIHIGKGVALPHARPEEGVKKLGMSLLKLSEPVFLLNKAEYAVFIFICLAATDNESHLRALASLTKILTNERSLKQLLQAETSESIVQIIKEKEGEESK